MRHHQPSGLQQGLNLLIDPHWSPEQVMAVIELLDDLRNRIWNHYEAVLLESLANDRITCYDADLSDPPF